MMKKRILASLLSIVMLICMAMPITSAAAEEGMACQHHTEHTAECGYKEAVQSRDCAHSCGWACYEKTFDCPHTEHDEACGYTDGTAQIPEIPCSHVHDANCGYLETVQATDAVPCDFVHSAASCGCDGAETSDCTHHCADGNCSYAEAVEAREGSPCTHVCTDGTCGYCAAVPEVPGNPCSHTHSAACYTIVTECTLGHDEALCNDTCRIPVIACVHMQHDADCGYVEAAEESICTFACTECEEAMACACGAQADEAGTVVHEEGCDLYLEPVCNCGSGNERMVHAHECPRFLYGRVEVGNVYKLRSQLMQRLYRGAECYLVCEFDGYVTVEGRHEGIDFGSSPDAPIYAVLEGEVTVLKVDEDEDFLSCIAIYNPAYDYSVFYFHADPLDTLTIGTWVNAGDLLGREGSFGCADYHTHLELLPGRSQYAHISVGDPVLNNPNPYPIWKKLFQEPTFYEKLMSCQTMAAMYDVLFAPADETEAEVDAITIEEKGKLIAYATTLSFEDADAREQVLSALNSWPICIVEAEEPAVVPEAPVDIDASDAEQERPGKAVDPDIDSMQLLP